MLRSKAFFLNGGAGRMLCSIPALEKYEEESDDKDFIIVCEGGTDMFKGHPKLHKRAYDPWHKNLFENEIKHRQVVNPEPYQVWEYYNQKCNLSQAFDLILNNKGVRELPKPTVRLSKDEILVGRSVVNEVKEKLKKDKVIVVQPFGRGVEIIDDTPMDSTGRSLEFSDLKRLLKSLEKDYGIIMMSELKMELKGEGLKNEIAMPEGLGLRQWAAVIKCADHFLGCDSVGQHLAYAVDTETTVVTGSTFPENVSYPNKDTLKIVDLGMRDRQYDPIRITVDEAVNRANEGIMQMDDAIREYVLGVIKREIDPDEDE